MNLRLVACEAALLLGGYQLINAAEDPTDLYTITPKSTFEPDMPAVFWQLAVEEPNASAYRNTSRIAIAQSQTSSDYYAKTGWTDRAPLMVQTRIVDSFENSNKIIAVARAAIGLRANYVLQSALRDAQATYLYGKQPIAHVRLVAKLVRMPDRQIIGVGTFERCVRARADKVPKVVEAFDQALGSVMKRLVAWTLRAAPTRPPSEESPYDINRYRNPDNAYLDSEGCPKGNDASMVPLTDE